MQAVADFNGDGFPDVAGRVLNSIATDGVGVRLGLGGGRLDAERFFASTDAQRFVGRVVAGDFNADSKKDLAWVQRSTSTGVANQVRWRLGDGAGGFGALQTTSLAVGMAFGSAGQSINDVVAADVNGDGRSDVVAVGGTTSNLGVWAMLAQSGGGFAAPVRLLAGQAPVFLRTADLNGDGRVDLEVSDYLDAARTSIGMRVALSTGPTGSGYGTPTYTAFQANASGIYDGGPAPVMVLSDVTGDGKFDAVVAVRDNGANNPAGVYLYSGNSTGGFLPGVLLTNSWRWGVMQVAATGDFDLDGVTDIATYLRQNGTSSDRTVYFKGLGGGSFNPAALIGPYTAYGWNDVAATDVNGDGRRDLLVYPTNPTNPARNGTEVWLNTSQPVQVPEDQTIGINPDDPDAAAAVPDMFEQRSDGVDAEGGGSGSFTHVETDVSLPGPGITFAMTRSNSSNDPSTGILGAGWTFGYGGQLTELPSLDVKARAGSGQVVLFARQPDGSYVAPAGVRAKLTKTGTTWSMTSPQHQVFTFDASGQLTAMVDEVGQGLAFAYSAGKMSQITDPGGRVIALTYNVDGLLDRVTLPDGRYVGYTYTAGRLTGVRDLRGGAITYTYDTGGRLATMVDQNSHSVFQNTYDQTSGRLTQQRDAKNALTTFAWDPATGTRTTTDPRLGQWKQVYAGNVLIREVDPLGNTTNYGYDKDLNRFVTVDALANATTSVYDVRGNETRTIGPSPSTLTTNRTFDAQDNLTVETNPRGKTTNYFYNAANQLIRKQDAALGDTTYTYTPKGQVATVTNPRLKVTTYTYDAAGNQISATTPLGNKTTMTYDGSGRMLTRVSPRGNVSGGTPANFTTTYVYNDGDLATSVTDPLGHATAYAYDPVGNKTTVTDSRNKITTMNYDELNRVTSVTDPRNGTTQTTYDPNGNVSSRTTQTGDKTTYTYDAANRQTTMVTPRGNVLFANPADYTWTYTYDEVGNRTQVADPLGNTSGASYDENHRVTTSYDALSNATSTEYDQNDNATKVTDPVGRITTNTYDNLDRLATTVSPRGNVTGGTPANYTTTYTYDANGNRLSATTPLGGKTTWTYDDDDRKVTMVDPRGNVTGGTPATYTTTYTYDADSNETIVKDPLNNQTTRGYDRAGNLTDATDALGHVTKLAYDELDRLTSVTGPDAPTCTTGPVCVAGKLSTVYALDDTGNVVTRTDPNNHATAYTYDLAARVTQQQSPIGQTWTYAYDPEGRNQTTVTARGNASVTPSIGTITNTYDRVGRLTNVDYGDATPDLTFTYDAAGRRTNMTDGAGTETYGYNNANQITSVARPATGTTGYAYDPDSNITTRTYPDTTAVGATFDRDGRIATIIQGTLTTTFAYDPAGRLTTTTLPTGNGHVETRTYDAAGRLTVVKNAKSATTLSQFTRTFDGVGNPTRIDTLRGTTTTNEAFLYDPADRLTKWCQSTTCSGATKWISYTYDPIGNRTQDIRTGIATPGTTNYTYNNADQLTQTVNGATTTNYGYDPDGNQALAGTRTFAYDLANRMTSTQSGATTTTYAYDGNGNRFTRATNATIDTRYAWDTHNPVAELTLERTSASALIRRYINGPGGDPLAYQTSATATWWYHKDPIGSVTDVTSSTGTAQWLYSYEPYGAPLVTTKVVTTAPANNTRFTGEYLDTETSNYYLRARQYDPVTGRFAGLDPVDGPLTDPFAGDYVYAGGNPVLWTDPAGTCLPGIGKLCKAGSKVKGAAKKVVSTTKNFSVGAAQGAYSATKGTVSAIAHPVQTVKGIGACIGNAVKCGKAVGTGLKNTGKALASGDAKRAGKAFGELAVSVVGAKGLGAGAKGASASRKAATAARTDSRAGSTAANTCSFGGATLVQMQDGTKSPIDQIEVGDRVVATDPETGQQIAARVTHVLVHRDTLTDLAFDDGTLITTTEDHPYWSVTKQRFERADQLEPGEKVLTAVGRTITVAGLQAGTSRDAFAYNLSVEGIHTYHVGEDAILVHNSCYTSSDALSSPHALEGLAPSQIGDLAVNAGFDVMPGKASSTNPATRYYAPGTKGSTGFRVLPQGVTGQSGTKGSPYLRYFGGPNHGTRVPLATP